MAGRAPSVSKGKEEGSKKEDGDQLATVSCSSWSSLEEDMDTRADFGAADINLIHDHKCGPRHIEVAKLWCKKKRYKSKLSPAIKTHKVEHADTGGEGQGLVERSRNSGGHS